MGQLIKNDKTTTLARRKTDIGEIVIKRYNTKNLWHLFRRNFQFSRAANCLKISQCFSQYGIAVAEPIVVIESVCGFLKGRLRFLEYALLLDFLNGKQDKEIIESVKSQIKILFRTRLENKLSHGDMKATNISVKIENVVPVITVKQQGASETSIVLIDLDSARKHRFSFFHKMAIVRGRNRFLKNWSDHPVLLAPFSESLSFVDVGE